MQINISLGIILTFLLECCVCKSYKNYTLYRVIPENDSELMFISTLHTRYDVNYWREPSLIRMPVEFVLHPDNRIEFLKSIQDNGIRLQTLIEDVQSAFDEQTVQHYIRRQMSSMNWNSYFRLEDIYNWLFDLSMVFPHEVQLIVIGNSHENRKIFAVKIVLNHTKAARSTVIIEGGVHAREWISPAVVTYLIDAIAHARTSNNDVLKAIAYTYEWYFVPILNPDGYEYTHTDDRLWRKNRNGYGVDINRNFDIAFGTKGVSMFPTSEIYCGPHAFSEKESSALAKLIKYKADKLEYYLAFHSYGQYMILPYGHSEKHLENYDQVHAACQEAAKSIAVKYRTRYKIGTPYETVGYTVSGISGCWVKKNYYVPYVVTFELRDEGAEGFALPPDQILPTCEETLDGIITLLIPKKANYTRVFPSIGRSGGSYKILDKLLSFSICFLFIIVRFEWYFFCAFTPLLPEGGGFCLVSPNEIVGPME